MVIGCARVPWCVTKEVLGEDYDTFQGEGKEFSMGMVSNSDCARMLPVRWMGKGASWSRIPVSCLCFMRASV